MMDERISSLELKLVSEIKSLQKLDEMKEKKSKTHTTQKMFVNFNY